MANYSPTLWEPHEKGTETGEISNGVNHGSMLSPKFDPNARSTVDVIEI
jgi:hypothetical protein